jgi:hypothetical protein
VYSADPFTAARSRTAVAGDFRLAPFHIPLLDTVYSAASEAEKIFIWLSATAIKTIARRGKTFIGAPCRKLDRCQVVKTDILPRLHRAETLQSCYREAYP